LAPQTVKTMPDCLQREPMIVFATGFDDAGTEEQVRGPEFRVSQAFGISVKVVGLPGG